MEHVLLNLSLCQQKMIDGLIMQRVTTMSNIQASQNTLEKTKEVDRESDIRERKCLKRERSQTTSLNN
nr:hypothetical protein [Tanacetum cinerariifolium]